MNPVVHFYHFMKGKENKNKMRIKTRRQHDNPGPVGSLSVNHSKYNFNRVIFGSKFTPISHAPFAGEF